jgi:hypothetical protein
MDKISTERLELSRGAASKVALDAIAEKERAEARIKALEEALRPFADEAKELAAGVPDNAVYALADFPDLGVADFIVRDLRRVSAALSQGGGNEA